MGATNSKVEEDKALQLCRERKKFVRQALDGRCSLAATHFTYIESLTIIGNALRRFFEPQAPIESSLYTSTSATPEPHALTEKSVSRFSFSSASISQHVGAAGNRSPSPSPPSTSRYHANHMRIRGTFSRKVEEKPSVPVMGSVTSSSTPRNTAHGSVDGPETPFDPPPMPSETQPWDYFGLFHPIDNDFASQDARELNQGLENYNDTQRVREEEGFPEMEDKAEKNLSPGVGEGQESEDEFDEPSTDRLVRSFENVNRAADNVTALPSMPSAESMASETESLKEGRYNSPELSPLGPRSSGASNIANPQDEKTEVVKEDGTESKVVPKDFISSMRDIEHFFVRASECGKEVPRMLEANKLHFRPIFPGKERGSFTDKILKACLSCGDDPSQVQEVEPAQNDTKYLTWHRSTSSRASSFRHDPGANTRENVEDVASSLFDNFCMNAGSHASTLDRLYAWEKKLYDEVKASEMLRKVYDQKRKLLRQLESNGESSRRIDKTRAIVKDLHWRIGVSIHRIDSISRRIEDLRDHELQPQLDELIEGLRKMWEAMHECHKNQFLIISAVYNNAHAKISLQSDSHRQITVYLESELSTLSSSFTKWIGSQKTYVQSLNRWLHKCGPLTQQSTKRRKRRFQPPSLRNYGPPIYVTCGLWLDELEKLPTKDVADSIKALAAEIDRFLPRQEKNHSRRRHDGGDPAGVNLLSEDDLADRNADFDRLRSRLEGFLRQLNRFSGMSVEMFTDLQKAVGDRKNVYAQDLQKAVGDRKNVYAEMKSQS